MTTMQKMGGIAALINGAAYIIGMGLAFTLLAPIMAAEPAEYLAFLSNNQGLMATWHLIIYLVTGVFTVPLALALHERLKDGAPALMQVATAFGLVWVATVISSGMIIVNDVGVLADLQAKDPAQAATVWRALSAVENGLGGAIELPGGLWVLLTSLAALRSASLPKALGYLGLLVGGSGIVMVIPQLAAAGSAFGLGAIVWFVWVGIVLLRGDRRTRNLAGARLAS
jgi:hypothetical protein